MSLALGVEVGIPLGVATDVAFLIYRAARPVIAVNELKANNIKNKKRVSLLRYLIYFIDYKWHYLHRDTSQTKLSLFSFN